MAYVGKSGGAHVYVFHAPATSKKAERVTAFIALFLDYHFKKALGASGEDWLVIGDLNVEPGNLNPAVKPFSVYPLTPTFPRTKKTYDYILTSMPNKIKDVEALPIPGLAAPGKTASDHHPILVRY